MTTATIRIDGMTCGHCERAVAGELAKLDGVSDIRVSAAEGAAAFNAASPIGREQLAAAVAEAGYELVDA